MKKIIKVILNKKNIYKWKFEYYIFVLLKKYKKVEYSHMPDGKTLIIVPHADDEVLGAYGYIKSHMNTDLFYMGFTGSNTDELNKRIRDKELIVSAKKIGVKLYCLENETLLNVLEKNEYNNILCPAIIDWHKEHRLCNKILFEALSNSKNNNQNIYWYSITVPIMSSRKQIICIPMEKKVQKLKYDFFKKIYTSQSFMPIKRFEFQERINAISTDFYSCENIFRITIEELGDYVEILYGEDNKKELEAKLNNLKKKISNLILIRKESAELYSIFENRYRKEII